MIFAIVEKRRNGEDDVQSPIIRFSYVLRYGFHLTTDDFNKSLFVGYVCPCSKDGLEIL